MRRSNVRGVVAMEEEEVRNEEIVAAAERAEAPVDLDNAESVETELLEVAEAEAEGDYTEDQIEEAGEVVEALESIANALKISAANGGMDKYSAHAVSIATKHLYSRVGIKTNASVSLESFSGAATRIGATQLAMEDIVTQAKKIWADVIAAIEKMIQWGKDFITKLFSSWEKIDARATTLAAKAKDAKSTAKIDNAALIEKLTVGGKPDVLANVDYFKTFLVGGFEHTTKSNEFYSTVIKTVSDANTKEAIMGPFDASPLVLPGQKDAPANEPELTDSSIIVYISEHLLGNWELVSIMPKSNNDTDVIKAISKLKFNLRQREAATQPKEIPSLDEAGVTKITKAVSAVAKAGIAYKPAANKAESMKSDLVAIAKKLSNKAGADGDITETSLRAAIIAISKNLSQPGAVLSAYALRTSKSLLDYVELSLKGEAKPA